jgi:hypothetical protein
MPAAASKPQRSFYESKVYSLYRFAGGMSLKRLREFAFWFFW